ncbi:MAG: ABC transporter ATP-binding protein [Bdellovibrionota bacterium]|jgi:phospholipid/cholesterol/gamma-HCH transport system ATP-binding protein
MTDAILSVKGLQLGYGDYVLQRDLTFDVKRGDIFFIMGGSGCGKSTLLKSLIGLTPPQAGAVFHNGKDFWNAPEDEQSVIMRNFGMLYQAGALWSSMTLKENVCLPLKEYSKLGKDEIDEMARLKLALVGLAGFEEFYPSEISGGMRKRAALARAIALDPHLLFLDEPSAGLDPITSKLLDDLIVALQQTFGMTVIIVSHELASILSIGTNSVFLDNRLKTMTAYGNPSLLLKQGDNKSVVSFLSRGENQ